MLGLYEAREAILRDLDSFVDTLDRLEPSEWTKPTPCEGWTIRDLAQHVAEVVHIDTDVLRKKGTGTPAGSVTVTTDDLVMEIRTARKAYGAELDGLTDDNLNDICTFQAASGLALPLSFTLQVSAMEFGTHRNDLERAQGASPHLAADTVRACASLAAGLLPFLANGASETPSDGVAYAIRSPNVDVAFVYRDGEWQPGTGDRTCTIEGDDETVALYALGRIPAADVKSSDAELAAKFKTYFPGP
jgi:uncharacterized protein (TIGR03083 family)